MRSSFPLASALVMVLLGTSRVAFAQANCPGNVYGNWSAGNTDYQQTTASADCIDVNANNVTIDLQNRKLICNNASGCNYGVSTGSSTGVTIQNGYIVAGTGKWYGGVAGGASSGVVTTTTVSHISVSNAVFGVVQPYKVNNSIFTSVESCLFDFLANSTGGTINSNYCSAIIGSHNVNFAFLIGGPSSSTNQPVIRSNYIFSTATGSTGAAVDVPNGFANVKNNIVDGGGDFLLSSSTTTSGNTCPDSTTCPNGAPGAAYGTQPNFDMTILTVN